MFDVGKKNIQQFSLPDICGEYINTRAAIQNLFFDKSSDFPSMEIESMPEHYTKIQLASIFLGL